MSSRRYLLIVCSIVVAALMIGILVFPGIKTLYLMRYYNKEYEPSFSKYQELYDKGDRSLSVINPLVSLNLDHANVKAAIQLMEEFEKTHPGRKDVLKSLAELYLGADKPSSYLQTMSKLYAIAPSKDILRDLISYYYYYGDKEQWIKYLKILTSEYNANDNEYETLALYYAKEGQLDLALSAADKALLNCKDYSKCGFSAALKANLLLDQGKPEEALAFSEAFVQKGNAYAMISDLVGVFLSRNRIDDAFQLLASVPERYQYQPNVIDANIDALYALSDDAKIYEYLKNLSEKEKLPESQINNLINLGLTEEREPAEFERIILGHNFSSLTDSTWLSLIEKAYKERLLPLLQKITGTIPKEALITNPVLRYAYEMSKIRTITPNDLAFYLRPDLEPLTDEERATLAIVYQDQGLNALAKDELLALPSFDGISEGLLSRLVFVYIENDIASDGYEKIVDLRDRIDIPPTGLNVSWLVLSVATGREDQAIAWILQNSNQITERDLKQVYDAAIAVKNGKTALVLAELLLKRNPSWDTSYYYADALVLNGDFTKGIALLQDLVNRNPKRVDAQISLLIALSKEAKNNPEYQTRMQELLNTLIDDRVLTTLQKRNIGYALYEQGQQAEAARLFFQLAQSSESGSDDIQMLLYLWGDKINDDQANWLAAQASLAEGKEKGVYLLALSSAGYAELVYHLVTPDDLKDPDIFDSYILALAELHKEDEVKALLEKTLTSEVNLKRLRNLAGIALGNSLNAIAELIYLRILELSPQDKEALRDLGNLYYGQAAFSSAWFYLSLYLNLYEGDALTYFHIAEMYNRDGDLFHARNFYYAAIASLPEMREEILKAKGSLLTVTQIEATSYYRLNYPFTAVAIYEAGLPEEKDFEIEWRGSFANLLLDLDSTGYAAYLLFNKEYKRTKENRQALLYIENLRMEWLRKANFPISAYAQSDYVLTQYREEGYAWAYRAQLEYYMGYWRQSLNDYKTASSLEPRNEDFLRSQKEIIDQHRSFTGLEWEYKTTGTTQKEHIWRLQEAFNPVLHSRYLFLAEFDRFNVTSYTNAVTGLTDAARGGRSRFTLSWIYDYFCGVQTEAMLFAAARSFGAGYHYFHPDLYGKTGFGIEFRRPNWDFAETLVQHGTRDRIFIERIHRLWERIDGLFRIEGRRYHMDHTGRVAADSIAWSGDIAYTLPEYHWISRCLGRNSSAVVNYNIDAEYGTWTKQKTNAVVGVFTPLAVGEREIHTIELTVNKTQYRYCNMQAHFGFAYDRFGGVNQALAVYGASIDWIRRPGLNFQALYNHSPSTSTTGQNEDRLIFNLTYYY